VTTQLKCQLRKGGSPDTGVRTFDQDVVKVGSLHSADLCLDGIAGMHAVLERTEGQWRLVDLGSVTGSRLDDERIDKNALLPPTGTLYFGEWVVDFKIEGAPPREKPQGGNGRSTLDDAFRGIRQLFERPPREDREHHRALARSLLAELERLVAEQEQLTSLKKIVEMWDLQGDHAEKRKLLRSMIAAIRMVRHSRQHVSDALSEIDPEVVRHIYGLTPEQAYERARKYLDKMVMARQGRQLLNELNIGDILRATQKEEIAKGATKEAEESAALMKVLGQLANNLQRQEARLAILLLASLGRAAGHSPSDEELVAELDGLRACYPDEATPE